MKKQIVGSQDRVTDVIFIIVIFIQMNIRQTDLIQSYNQVYFRNLKRSLLPCVPSSTWSFKCMHSQIYLCSEQLGHYLSFLHR